MNFNRQCLIASSVMLAASFGIAAPSASAATAAELNRDGKAALNRLYAQSPRATRYARDARAILVFPKIVKAGLVVGGQGGEGVRGEQGQPIDHRTQRLGVHPRRAVTGRQLRGHPDIDGMHQIRSDVLQFGKLLGFRAHPPLVEFSQIVSGPE